MPNTYPPVLRSCCASRPTATGGVPLALVAILLLAGSGLTRFALLLPSIS